MKDITVECYGYRTLEKNREIFIESVESKALYVKIPSRHHTLIIEHGNGDDMQLLLMN